MTSHRGEVCWGFAFFVWGRLTGAGKRGSMGVWSKLWQLTKKAIRSRIGNREQWVRWLCENSYRHQRILAEKPGWLLGKDVWLSVPIPLVKESPGWVFLAPLK
jgi:hypothetical protein